MADQGQVHFMEICSSILKLLTSECKAKQSKIFQCGKVKVFHPYDLGLGAPSGMDRDGMDLPHISTFEHCTWGVAFKSN